MDYAYAEKQLTEIERSSVDLLFQTASPIDEEGTLEHNNNKTNNNSNNNINNNNNNNNSTENIKTIGIKSIDNICARLQLNVDRELNPLEEQQQHQSPKEQQNYTIPEQEGKAGHAEMLFCNQQQQYQQQHQQQQQQQEILLDHDDVIGSQQSPVNSEEIDSNIPDESETMSNDDGSFDQASVIVLQPDCEDNLNVDSEKCDLDADKLQSRDNKEILQSNMNSQNRSTQNNQKLKPRNSTHYNSWHYRDMILAIKAVQTKNLSMTAAAKKYGIPRTTLRHYLNDGTNKESKRAGFCLPKPQENTLVEYALQHRNLPEKQLYKFIFDRAKGLSSELTSVKGEEERRINPTPAWIRRFVYRQKRLHDLFPTLLSKLEHPLHGGRKSPADVDMNYDSSSQDRVTYDKVSMVASRRVSTEIIFPKRSPSEEQQHHYDAISNVHNNEPHVTYEISKSPSNNYDNNTRNVIHSDEYISSDSSPTMKNVMPISSSSSVPMKCSSANVLNDSLDKEMLGKELTDYWHSHSHHYGNTTRSVKRTKPPQHHHVKHHNMDSEHDRIYYNDEPPRYKDQIPLLIDSNGMPPSESNDQTYFNKTINNNNSSRKYSPLINSATRCHSDENLFSNTDRREVYEERYSRQSSSSRTYNNRVSPYMNGSALSTANNPFQTVGSNKDIQLPPIKKRHQSPLYSSDENLSVHSPVLQNGILDTRPGMEIRCLRKSLDAMEYELGSSYVNMFTKRYQNDRKLERLYCKWVSLKSDLEKAQRIKELVRGQSDYSKNMKEKFYSHSP